jgi:hypothetical protein
MLSRKIWVDLWNLFGRGRMLVLRIRMIIVVDTGVASEFI